MWAFIVCLSIACCHGGLVFAATDLQERIITALGHHLSLDGAVQSTWNGEVQPNVDAQQTTDNTQELVAKAFGTSLSNDHADAATDSQDELQALGSHRHEDDDGDDDHGPAGSESFAMANFSAQTMRKRPWQRYSRLMATSMARASHWGAGSLQQLPFARRLLRHAQPITLATSQPTNK